MCDFYIVNNEKLIARKGVNYKLNYNYMSSILLMETCRLISSFANVARIFSLVNLIPRCEVKISWKMKQKNVPRIKTELPELEFVGRHICFNIYKIELIKLPATMCSAASKSHYDLSAERRELYWQLFVWQSPECISMYNRTMLALDTK